jgi:multidrug efflux pump subunit AcrA (membrane-fusion protein)
MSRRGRLVRGILTVVAILVIVPLILWLGGFLPTGDQVTPGVTEAPAGRPSPEVSHTVERVTVPTWYEAVGTIESRTTASVAAQISARVVSVLVDAGDQVEPEQVLVHLDDRELQARRQQAEGALAAAQAALAEAERGRDAATARLTSARSAYDRTRKFHTENVATDAELEVAESEFRQAEAGAARGEASIERAQAEVERARQAVTEAGVALGYAKVVSPMAGEVSRREVDPGDLAWPGRTLLVLQDRVHMRLRASIREGLWGQVAVGTEVEVVVPATGDRFPGSIAEIEPAADPRTRSFVVEVPLPETSGLYPGMFGKLRLQLGERETVLIPRECVIRVGQLDMVLVQMGDRWGRRQVRLGMTRDDQVEVLSGLAGGEEIGR